MLIALTGSFRRIARELAVSLLFSDKKFAKKNCNLWARLVIHSILSSGNEKLLLAEPFSTLYNMEKNPGTFTLKQIEAMKEIYSSQSHEYFVNLYTNDFVKMPAGMQNNMFGGYKKISGALDSAMALSDYTFNRFMTNNSFNMFEDEIKHVESRMNNLYGKNKREVLLVGGKRKIDQFFGHVGEVCIAHNYSEITRNSFTPLRIIDFTHKKLIGYVHFFFFEDKKYKIAMLGGIEPKTSWASHIDVVDFYQGIRSKLVEYAKELNANMLCFTAHPTAHSNCWSLAEIIQPDLRGKPVIVSEKQIRLPSNNGYDLSNMVVLWSDVQIKLAPGIKRFSGGQEYGIFMS